MTSIFENKNSFWPEYKNLEQQVLELAKHVCFCDEQVNVFSRENSNLILQIGSEIESISKELFRSCVEDINSEDEQSKLSNLRMMIAIKKNQILSMLSQINLRMMNALKKNQKLSTLSKTNLSKKTTNKSMAKVTNPHFDYVCLKKLNKKWYLTRKEISVTGVNFYFKDNFQSFAPLAKVYCKGKCQWKEAYNELKHDNRECIKSATIGNLMSALGALFVLNLYYRDLNCDDYKFYLNGDLFDSRVGSEIFSVNCYEVLTVNRGKEMGDNSIAGISQDELAKAIYIKKYDDESMKFMHRMCCLDYLKIDENFNTAPELQPYRDNPKSPEYQDLTTGQQICYKIGGEALVKKIFNYENTKKTIRMTLGREILLNTHSRIYDTVTLDDFNRYYEEEVKKSQIEVFFPCLSSMPKP